MQEIADWLKTLGLSEYAKPFAENGIDVSALRHLTDQEQLLKPLGESTAGIVLVPVERH